MQQQGFEDLVRSRKVQDENGEPHDFGSRRPGTFSTHQLVTRLDFSHKHHRPTDENAKQQPPTFVPLSL